MEAFSKLNIAGLECHEKPFEFPSYDTELCYGAPCMTAHCYTGNFNLTFSKFPLNFLENTTYIGFGCIMEFRQKHFEGECAGLGGTVNFTDKCNFGLCNDPRNGGFPKWKLVFFHFIRFSNFNRSRTIGYPSSKFRFR